MPPGLHQGGHTMTISEFLQQLSDGDLTHLEDMVTKEYRRRAENMVNGVGEAVPDPVDLNDARVTTEGELDELYSVYYG
jgi:hypothetical protein